MLKRLIGLGMVVFVVIQITYAESTIQEVFQLKGEPKVAFIYLGPSNDGGWTESHDIARRKIEKELGIKIAYSENIPEETTKVRQAIDLYVQRGYNIIVGTSYGYGDAFLEGAKEYPNVAFLNAAGETNWRNLESFYARTYQGWYLAGIIAGSMSKNGKLGMLGGFPLALVNWDINGFARGVQSVNSDAEVSAIFVNTWYDPVKEGQMAEALLEQGIDVVATDLSAASALSSAEKIDKYSVGFQIDMSKHAPKGHLTSVTFHWDAHLVSTIRKIMNGTWVPSKWGAFVGIDIGAVGLSPINKTVPPEVLAKVEAAKKEMLAGKLTPFDGPIYSQDGTLTVKAGHAMADGELWGMNFFVKGITGKMPAEK
jgi:basic membrane protein A and related proteins